MSKSTEIPDDADLMELLRSVPDRGRDEPEGYEKNLARLTLGPDREWEELQEKLKVWADYPLEEAEGEGAE